MRAKQFKRGSMVVAIVAAFIAFTVVSETQGQQKGTPRALAVAKVTDTNGSLKAVTQLLLEWADKRDSTKGQRTVALSTDTGQLRIPINSLKEIRRLPDGKHEVLYRNGLTQTGNMNAGNVTATTEVNVQGEVLQGTVNLPWTAVQVIELNNNVENQALEFTPPKGMRVTVKSQNGNTVELNGLLIYYTYMAPEYTHAYGATMRTTYDVIHDELLSYMPIMTKTGYDVDVSLSMVTNVLVSKSNDRYHVDVGVGTKQDKSSSQSGTLGWTHLEQERRQPAFHFYGCNQYGTWIIDMASVSTVQIDGISGAYPKNNVAAPYGITPPHPGATINGKPYAVHWSSVDMDEASNRDAYEVILANGNKLELIKASSVDIDFKQDGVNVSFTSRQGKLRVLRILGNLTESDGKATSAKVAFSLNATTSSEVLATISSGGLSGSPSGYDSAGCLCQIPWRNIREIHWTDKTQKK